MPEEKDSNKPKIDYQNRGIDELVENLKADVKNGLSAADVERGSRSMDTMRYPREKPILISLLQKNSGVPPHGCLKPLLYSP